MKKSATKRKPGAWFIPVRGSYLPASVEGWLTYIPFIGYLSFALYAGWHYCYSVGQAILFVVPNWVAATAIMTWIAKRKS